MGRQNSIDFIKFFLGIAIILHHFNFIFLGGYLAVEGFFMITGFLMMNSVYKKQDDAPGTTARFVLHKYLTIALPLFFSAISGFLIYELALYQNSLSSMLPNVKLLLYEIVPLQIVGYSAYYATGVSWYLASMLISTALLYPLAKKTPESFAYSFCPFAAILIYGFIYAQCGHLSVPYLWVLNGLVNTGLLRGIAGISSGCLLYALVRRSETHKTPTIAMRIFYTILELLGWYALIRLMTTEKLAKTSTDFIFVPIMFAVLYLAFSKKTLFALFINHKWTTIFSTFSTYMYLNHYAWAQYFIIKHADKPQTKLLPWYVLCIIVSSACVYGLTKLTEWIIAKIRFYKKEEKKAEIPSSSN